MKILFVATGTRGDMEPFLAIAQILKKRKEWNTIMVFPEHHGHLVSDSKLPFHALPSKQLRLLEASGFRSSIENKGPAGGIKLSRILID